ncbi:unnamed protein product [Soboliphyme baturini]|uniref:Lipase domain-containing protein n=1 Tax=Soboliphyme baturini TaxID=241478 RepID=A0A183IW20_9BILA|nr:unnamed protein product [Soboliphyme baturini]
MPVAAELTKKEVATALQEMDAKFVFYTNKVSYSFNLWDFSRQPARYNISSAKSLHVIVHGFGPFPEWVVSLSKALFKKGKNAAYIDWRRGSKMPNYLVAAKNTYFVGRGIAEFLKANGVSMNTSTCVGFSLGAHVCGFAGASLGNLFQIVGLDPAGPLFSGKPPNQRLDKTDAAIVRCIHTSDFFGTYQAMGDIDFFANGGDDQKSCTSDDSPRILSVIENEGSANGLKDLICSHSLAHIVYTQSVKLYGQSDASCNFTSVPCGSKQDFMDGRCFLCGSPTKLPVAGYNEHFTDIKYRGSYYFDTVKDLENTDDICGRMLAIELQSLKNIKGSITLQIYGEGDASHKVVFQRESEVLPAGTPKRVIAAIPYKINQPTKVRVVYQRYHRWWSLNAGPKVWTLNKISFLNLDCKT